MHHFGFKSVSTTGNSHEHLVHKALQGKTANLHISGWVIFHAKLIWKCCITFVFIYFFVPKAIHPTREGNSDIGMFSAWSVHSKHSLYKCKSLTFWCKGLPEQNTVSAYYQRKQADGNVYELILQVLTHCFTYVYSKGRSSMRKYEYEYELMVKGVLS